MNLVNIFHIDTKFPIHLGIYEKTKNTKNQKYQKLKINGIQNKSSTLCYATDELTVVLLFLFLNFLFNFQHPPNTVDVTIRML